MYSQSSSGGLYRGESLGIAIAVAADAAAHVTTQSATIVHDSRGEPATQRVRLSVETNGFLAFTPDPSILFPGAALISRLTISLAAGSVAFLSDAFTAHDPGGGDRHFEHYSADVFVEDESGRVLVRDRMSVAGNALADADSPHGRWPTAGTLFLLGNPSHLPDRAVLAKALDGDGIVAGITSLPTDAGFCVRSLAADTRPLKRLTDALFALVVHARFGAVPQPRRK